ncbi:TetR/AcrR family transcriptional regulator [Asanoa sp. NPDC050611]|uniref:TetR/AcrR family transcriptional regulator n=1 Tax=Asanoa sp. NPDC050611 TaxID=3157098 RepID=UPI0033E16D2D
MPKLTEARRELRRDQIVQAARRCFVRTGMERTSVADITAESGLSAGSIYAHFTGKADIVRAVVQDSLDRRAELVAAFAASPHPPNPAQVILQLAAAADPDDARIALQALGEATTDPAIRDIVGTTIDRMHALFRASCEAWLVKSEGHAADAAAARATRLAGHLVAVFQSLLIQNAFPDGPGAVDATAVADLVAAQT